MLWCRGRIDHSRMLSSRQIIARVTERTGSREAIKVISQIIPWSGGGDNPGIMVELRPNGTCFSPMLSGLLLRKMGLAICHPIFDSPARDKRDRQDMASCARWFLWTVITVTDAAGQVCSRGLWAFPGYGYQPILRRSSGSAVIIRLPGEQQTWQY